MNGANIAGMFCGLVCMWRSILDIKFGFIDTGLLLAGILLMFV